MQAYSNPKREGDKWALPDIEVFYAEEGELWTAEEALAVLKADCEQFQRDYADALDRLNDGVPDRYAPYGADMAGHDLWLSRNGHGTGFFDRYMRGRDGLPYMPEAAAARLQEIARGLPSRDLYRGDDGLIYVS